MADALFVRIDGIDYELVKTASRKGDKCLDCDLSCGDGKCGATRLPWTVCMALSIADENNDFVFRKKTFASFTVDGLQILLATSLVPIVFFFFFKCEAWTFICQLFSLQS